jgi:coenzyme F420-reducing hydrogenase delta subunit
LQRLDSFVVAHARRQGGDGVTKGVAGVPTTEPAWVKGESHSAKKGRVVDKCILGKMG